MSRIAIIPARGGSKRIPRKNIKDFLGKPIIAYSIEAALKSGLFDEVMVSTDDPEIKEIAILYGAKVPFMRSNENSGDFATTVDVILEVLTAYSSQGRTFLKGCCIYPTAPFVNLKTLQEGLSLLVEEGYDTVFPVVPFSYPIWRAFEIAGVKNKMSMLWPANQNRRSQDLKPAYHDAGQFYWFDVQMLSENRELYTQNTGSIIQTELEVHDIDTVVDWQLAEMKYRLLYEA